MTAFEEIQVGDKIRAWHIDSGDVVIGRVEARLAEDLIQTETVSIHVERWGVDVVEKALPKLPTGHLAMVGKAGWTPYILIGGRWRDVDRFGDRVEMGTVSDDEVRRAIANDGFRVLYEGLPE